MTLIHRFIVNRVRPQHIAHIQSNITRTQLLSLPTNTLRLVPNSCANLQCRIHTTAPTTLQQQPPQDQQQERAARRQRIKQNSGQPPVPLSTPTTLPTTSSKIPSFASFGLASFLCHRLESSGLHKPTTIQAALMPHLMRRPWDAPSYPDLIVQEMTGQGKTLAYLLPMLNTIDRSLAAIQGIIVVPTRELAIQVARVAQELAGNIPTGGQKSKMSYPLSVTTLVGQVNPTMLSTLARSSSYQSSPILADEMMDSSQLPIAQAHPHLIIATPGVLHEIFIQRKLPDVQTVLPLTHLKYLVFDEIDALLNSAATRNTIVPLIQLRHQATALDLQRVKEEQKRLDESREERRKKRTAESKGLAELDENEIDQQPSTIAPVTPSDSSPTLPTFPRNQVVILSATITTAVHQFAARYLSQSRAFITSQSIAHALRKNATATDSTSTDTDASLTQTPSSIQRIPPHVKHYYLLINRPYDRLNSLQQLLQSIKLQFDSWKRTQLVESTSDEGDMDAVLQKPTGPVSASWFKKHVQGPERALSAGGMKRTNQASPVRFLRGGVSSLGLGARGHFLQSSLVFVDQREELARLVNPLSQQGFNLGVVSEHSGRHERREALRLERTELLLATDVLSRGMDLKSLTHVVNYTPPPTPNLYLHRAGRVGRLGAVHAKLGTVITLIDLEADPSALQHLSKIANSLGGHMEFRRIYCKKGKLFEDQSENSIITAEHVPSADAFTKEPAGEQLEEEEDEPTEAPPARKSSQPRRVHLGSKTTAPKKSLRSSSSSTHSTTATTKAAPISTNKTAPAHPRRASTAPLPQLPIDPIGAQLGIKRSPNYRSFHNTTEVKH